MIALKVLFSQGPQNSGIEILLFYFMTLNLLIFFFYLWGEMGELVLRVGTCQTYLPSMVALIQCEFKHL